MIDAFESRLRLRSEADPPRGTPMELCITPLAGESADARPLEVVERKGLGHPDSICDALAEEFSLELSRFYRERFGRILHHNVDKVLLRAGVAAPAFGGGKVEEPIQILLAGRASTRVAGVRVPLEELALGAAQRWLRDHLQGLDPEAHVELRCGVRPGAPELVELFDREARDRVPLANDTSCGVGFAPLSRLERTVLAVEQGLNAAPSRTAHPEAGEDVKVMGVRRGERIDLTVACAMLGGQLADADAYRIARAGVAERAARLAREVAGDAVDVVVNAADAPERGSFYLTVTGTSAEGGDDGEAGRGNRANGLITPGRPMTLESVAGKNPTTHVGKLYNLAAGLLAAELVEALPEVSEAQCLMVSRIGEPVTDPAFVDLRLRLPEATPSPALAARAAEIAREQLERVPELWRELLDGRLRIDRWPFQG